MAKADWAEDWKEEVCDMIAGGESVRELCRRKDPRIPSEKAIYRALELDGEFRQQYARARARQADSIFHETRTIADNVAEAHEAIGKARLRIDQRKWAAGKLSPKKYGTQNVNLSGEVNIDDATPQDEAEAIKANLPLVISILADLGYSVTGPEE